jgi:AAA+ superfamily predicted ATPase
MSLDRIEGLRRALAASPENHSLRLLLAETLAQAARPVEALAEYEQLLAAGQLEPSELVAAGRVALAAGRHDRAQAFLDAANAAGVVEGATELAREIDLSLGLHRIAPIVQDGPGDSQAAGSGSGALDSADPVRFADVGGLAEMKKAIQRTIILPFQRRDLFEKYKRAAGGGVLLYGPPGCGKSLLARATAGECGLPFWNVRIEEILDPLFGVSERNLHEMFALARASAPCVLFVDELDAIGFARRKYSGSAGRALVDQLLQELDAIGSDNHDILVLAATNAPWDVDSAVQRPGRFDRILFVPPPDSPARERILSLHLDDRPADKIDLSRIAKRTPLFSGADLRALVDRAADLVIDDALDRGNERPLSTRDLERALTGMRPTTLDWIATARSYVEFANQSGRYDEVATFLASSEARSWKT